MNKPANQLYESGIFFNYMSYIFLNQVHRGINYHSINGRIIADCNAKPKQLKLLNRILI